MIGSWALANVQCVASPPVAPSLAHETGAERVTAYVAVVHMQQPTSVQVQLACALPVDGKLGT